MQGLVIKAARRGYVPAATRALALCVVAAGLAACGDDDGNTNRGDASTDAGEDAGGFIRPRRDAQVGTDPVPECDRFDPLACGAGQRCQVVIRRAAGQAQFVIYTGCVEDGAARGLGDPCEPWGGASIPYQVPGLEDEVYVDPCEEGLFCATDRSVRLSSTCQRACQSGRYERDGLPRVGCDSPTAFCSGPAMAPYEEVCREADGCDPTDPNGCGPGTGCYLRLNDTGTGILTVCLPTVESPVGEGMACGFLNDCAPGSSCWGPTGTSPANWTEPDLVCRRSCLVGATGDDAGLADEDGGVSSGGACSGAQECVGFDGSGLDSMGVSAALGQCE